VAMTQSQLQSKSKRYRVRICPRIEKRTLNAELGTLEKDTPKRRLNDQCSEPVLHSGVGRRSAGWKIHFIQDCGARSATIGLGTVAVDPERLQRSAIT